MDLLEQGIDDQINIDENKDYYAELVGDDKKFKTPQDLAKTVFYKDRHIETLERKADQLREDYIKLREEHMAHAKIEDLLNKRLTQPDNTSIPEDPKTQTWDQTKIESLVSTKMQEFETQKRQTENFNQVKNKLRERYGDNYQPFLNQQMTQLGLDADSLNTMARTQPNILVKALNLDVSAPSYDNLPRSSVRTDQFAPKIEKRTWSYYEKMRQTDPTRYYSPKITTQMEQDYNRLGTDFEDGDFNT